MLYTQFQASYGLFAIKTALLQCMSLYLGVDCSGVLVRKKKWAIIWAEQS